jgi:hypothetical protein
MFILVNNCLTEKCEIPNCKEKAEFYYLEKIGNHPMKMEINRSLCVCKKHFDKLWNTNNPTRG